MVSKMGQEEHNEQVHQYFLSLRAATAKLLSAPCVLKRPPRRNLVAAEGCGAGPSHPETHGESGRVRVFLFSTPSSLHG